MKGKLVVKAGALTPNGREGRIEVRRGPKGGGAQVGNTVVYWPWSGKSEEQAFEMAGEIARHNDIEIVPDAFED